MAKAKMIEVKALVNLKYDKEPISINEEFKVRIEDATEMAQKGYVEILDEVPEEKEGEGEPPEGGE